MKTNTRLCLVMMAALPLAAQTVDLTKPPVSKEARPYKLPPVSESKLANGLTVLLAEDNRFPMLTARLVFLAGNKRDPKDLPGLAASVAAMSAEIVTVIVADTRCMP